MKPATRDPERSDRSEPLRARARVGAVHLALPKGRMQEGVTNLLTAAGIGVSLTGRAYRPSVALPGFETKLLKPQNIVGMLAEGSRDVGFAGADWVAESGAELVELLDTGLDPVRIVAAAPQSMLDENGRLRVPNARRLVVASEYRCLTQAWMKTKAQDARFVRTFGATEVFPPEDADVIVDNTATGSTLAANGLVILDELMRSSTRLYASRQAMANEQKRARIEDLVVCLAAVLQARQRVMVELNVATRELDAVVRTLPCMREPTVSALHGGGGHAVRAAVPRDELPRLLPLLKASGAADIVVSSCEQIVP